MNAKGDTFSQHYAGTPVQHLKSRIAASVQGLIQHFVVFSLKIAHLSSEQN